MDGGTVSDADDDHVGSDGFEDHAPVTHTNPVVPFPLTSQRLGTGHRGSRFKPRDHSIEPNPHREGKTRHFDLSFLCNDYPHAVRPIMGNQR